MLFLLDTNIVIDTLKGRHDVTTLVRRAVAAGDDLATCDVVVAEVMSGTLPSEHTATLRALNSFRYLDTNFDTARQAGEWRYTYARRGVTLAITDLIIAAVAYTHGASVVTRNIRHFPMPEITVVPLSSS